MCFGTLIYQVFNECILEPPDYEYLIHVAMLLNTACGIVNLACSTYIYFLLPVTKARSCIT